HLRRVSEGPYRVYLAARSAQGEPFGHSVGLGTTCLGGMRSGGRSRSTGVPRGARCAGSAFLTRSGCRRTRLLRS
ncbi:unnamed protein product, partial [Ectocarpus sp. 12 AP-2014]